MRIFLALVGMMLFPLSAKSQNPNPGSLIFGVWQFENEPNHRWEFQEDGVFLDYFAGEKSNVEKYTFKILGRINSCSPHKSTDLPSQKYLQISNETGENFCYYLETVSETNLTLIYIPNGRILILTRVKELPF